jgi:hypothetical protein
LGEYDPERVVIYNAFIQEEHPDNRRFLADCERWFRHPITVLRNEKYAGSVHDVWRRRGVMKTVFGAPCSTHRKREVLDAVCLADDMHVFGFTADEADRAEKRSNPQSIMPLIQRGLKKSDCLALIERAGIELPMMYRLGYNNANCIGCCKGGAGYWNKIRRDFPSIFEEVANIESGFGNPNSYLMFNQKTGERYPLTQLDPSAGKHTEVLPDCSFFCAMAEEEMV